MFSIKNIFILLYFGASEVLCDYKSSLTFVIDDTGSMTNDIAQVKLGANAIFDTVLNSNESQIEDFVLVTFNDPGTNLRTITRDRDDFKRALSNIYVNGGGDCPEYSMSGIIDGITNSRPGSTIYVYTDASAKDYYKYNDVKFMAVKKQIQVVFVLTGVCGDRETDSGYKVYEKLAKDTVGQIFHLQKQEISEILKYVMDNIKGRKTLLAVGDFPPGTHSLNFTIDKHTKDPTVSATGHRPTIKVNKPDGEEAITESVVDTEKIAIVKMPDTKPPGVYTVEVSSSSGTHVLVSARTDIKFQQGFSIFQPSSIEETTTLPLPDPLKMSKGVVGGMYKYIFDTCPHLAEVSIPYVTDIKSHITIKLTDGYLELKTVQILDMEDNLIKEVSLFAVNELEKLYTTGLEDLPNTMFKIAIVGYDPDSDKYIKRIGSPIAAQPKPNPGDIISKIPTTTIVGPATQKVKWNGPMQLKCKVHGYPKPNIVWVNMKTGIEVADTPVSAVDLPYDFISILDVDNVVEDTSYNCKAENSLGLNFASVAIEITDKPYFNILKKPEDISINYLNEGELNCLVDAYPAATITWYKDMNYLLKNDNIEFSDDNSVVKIKKMSSNEDGNYICEVRNEYTRYILRAKVKLTGVELPVIDSRIEEIVAESGTDVVITCNILRGSPKPRIYWDFSSLLSEEIRLDDWDDQESITLRRADKSKSGIYSCLAKNDFGSDYHEVSLTIEYPVEIKEDKTEYTVAEGQSIIIPCVVEGYPDPIISLFKDSLPLLPGPNIYIYKDHSIRITAAVKDSGTYTCVAANKFGTVSRNVKVDVYVPVTIALPDETKIEVPEEYSLDLPCQAKGYPTPQTEWVFYSFYPTIPAKSMLKSVGASVLNLNNIQSEEAGFYTCIASNSRSTTNVTYEILVLTRPKIEQTHINKVFKVVEGDVVLMIHCKASGNPPPVIRWLSDKYVDSSASATETLLIKNLSKADSGFYVCEARNKVGDDTDTYQVIVDKAPQPGLPTSTIVIGDSSTASVRCDVPHKSTDQLRWYKNGVLIRSGELMITNAKDTDSGLYTCRVSNSANSTSGNTMVTVRMKPKFVRDEEEIINYDDGSPHVLSCEATGDPAPQFRWWHNDVLIDTRDDYLYLEMEVGSQGQYKCEAKNEFGSVLRYFNVTSSDCFIDLHRLSKLQPLMLSSSLEWPRYVVQNGYMSIPKNGYVNLFCPNHFKAFPNRHNLAFCAGGSTFKVQGQPFDYSDIECTEEVKHLVESDGIPCSNNLTVLLKVVFKVQTESVEAYEVCFDIVRNKPLHVTMPMRSTAADVDFPETKIANGELYDLDFDEAYKCSRQINVTSTRRDGCCYGKRMLVNPKDLFPGVAQRSAYSYLNTVPHWSTCNADNNNWNEVEQRVRSLAKASYSELLVSTGVAEDLSLNQRGKPPKDIFIADQYDNRQAVSKYLWKVVQDPDTKSSLAIIQVNIPDLSPREAALHVLCRDICSTTQWMKSPDWYDTRRGFTYCCSLKDFEDSFSYKSVFRPYYKVLNDVSLIPGSSLVLQ